MAQSDLFMILRASASYPLQLNCGDAVDFLKMLPDQSVDMITTDPPYESLEKHRKRGTTTRLKQSKGSSNEWFKTFGNERFPEFFREAYRVLAVNSHLYLFCDAETMFVVKPMGEEAGFKFWKPIIWDKVAIGMGYHYRARCERILFFEKGKRKLNNLGIPDILTFKRIHRGLPAEKPVDLVQCLVEQSTSPSEVVCDPFLGASGSAAVASLQAGRYFTGNEIDPGKLAQAIERTDVLANAYVSVGGKTQ
jgi:site-specific DNA-methyltransferase (adenine-specific)